MKKSLWAWVLAWTMLLSGCGKNISTNYVDENRDRINQIVAKMWNNQFCIHPSESNLVLSHGNWITWVLSRKGLIVDSNSDWDPDFLQNSKWYHELTNWKVDYNWRLDMKKISDLNLQLRFLEDCIPTNKK